MFWILYDMKKKNKLNNTWKLMPNLYMQETKDKQYSD